MSRCRFIAAEKACCPVARLGRVLRVSTRGFSAWRRRPPAARRQANDELTPRIGQVHQTSRGTSGAPRIQAELRAAGLAVNRKRVARRMRQAPLVGCRPRGFIRTTLADPSADAPDLVGRDFRAPAPDGHAQVIAKSPSGTVGSTVTSTSKPPCHLMVEAPNFVANPV